MEKDTKEFEIEIANMRQGVMKHLLTLTLAAFAVPYYFLWQNNCPNSDFSGGIICGWIILAFSLVMSLTYLAVSPKWLKTGESWCERVLDWSYWLALVLFGVGSVWVVNAVIT